MAVDTSGPGYLAGEYPGGITTVEGSPQAATVNAYYELPSGDWQLAASVMSSSSGTWQILNVNPDFLFHVLGRKAGYNDVLVSGVHPTRTDVITTNGTITSNADFNGASGSVTLVGGIPPYSATVTSPLPSGLHPVIDGRTLLVDGVSTERGEWNSVIRVAASNSVFIDVEVDLTIKSTWQPTEINPIIWLDWDSTLDVEGAAVTSWHDKTTNGYDFVQAVAGSRPGFTAGTSGSFRFLSFNSQFLRCTKTQIRSILANKSVAWAFAIYRKRGTDSSDQYRYVLEHGYNAGARFLLYAGDGSSRNRPGIGVRRLSSDSYRSLPAAAAVSGRWAMALNHINYSTGVGRVFVDGSLSATNPSLVSAGLSENLNDAYDPYIGAGHGSGGAATYFGDVDVAAIITGTSVITDADIDRIFGWAAHKLSLQSLLPAGHPYKTEAP